MKNVNREKLVATLGSVTAGLAGRKENVEQSSCFVFRKDKVITFNEEVMCVAKCKVGFEGAVPAAPLLTLLDRMTETEIQIGVDGNHLSIKGEGREASILFEEKITLPVSQVEDPKDWKPLPDKFEEAVNMVKGCCSNHDLKFELTCVHITSRYVEASDNVQCARHDLKMKVEKDFLIRAVAADLLVNASLSEFSESKNWVHFRSPSGRIISCRRYMEKYPSYDEVFKPESLAPFRIPSGLVRAVEKAQIFTAALESATTGRELVSIDLKKGRLKLAGSGTMGWYSEKQSIKYKGEEISFAMSPSTLRGIAYKHKKASLNEQKLVVDGDGWRMVFCLFEKPKGK
jgi:hypothetical protein